MKEKTPQDNPNSHHGTPPQTPKENTKQDWTKHLQQQDFTSNPNPSWNLLRLQHTILGKKHHRHPHPSWHQGRSSKPTPTETLFHSRRCTTTLLLYRQIPA